MTKPYERRGAALYQRYRLSTGNEIRIEASDVRKERGAVHARLCVYINDTILAWTNKNVEHDEDRVRLANSAHKHLMKVDADLWPSGHMKHALDLFCAGLWDAWIGDLKAELLEGDPDIGPPSLLLGSYIQEGGGTIMFAPPDRGKSYTLITMAVTLDAGMATLWPVKQRNVLVVNLERSRVSVRSRLAHINRALRLKDQRPLAFINARGRSLLQVADAVERSMAERGCDVLFLDSISRTGFGKLKDDDTANAIIDTLNRLAPTWFAIAHTPREDESHTFGSVHFDAGEDIGIQLLTQSGNGVMGIGLKVVIGKDISKPPMQVIAFEFDGSGLTAIRPAGQHEFVEIAAGERKPLADEIKEYLLMAGKATGTEIADAIGRNPSNVRAALRSHPAFLMLAKEGNKVFYGVSLG